jgi:hypothetical protein
VNYRGLIDTVADFSGDVLRNIPSVFPSEHLLDDLTSDPRDMAFGEALVDDRKDVFGPESPIITRPFTYGVSLSNTTSGNTVTRFSDGKRFGVWYGSLDLLTTVCETAYHFHRRLTDMLTTIDEEVFTHRRVFKVQVRGILIDLRGKFRKFPKLLDKEDYSFTHAVGARLHDDRQNGLLVESARYREGTNVAAFRPDILSNPRHARYLIYRWVPGQSTLSIEKNPGRTWKRIAV